MSRPRLLLISLDPVGEQMAGLGIRYTELARALSASADVTLAAPEAGGSDVPTIVFSPHAPGALREAIAGADAIVAHPQWPVVTRWMVRSGARLIYDLYDPETLETLELFRSASRGRRRLMAELTLDRLNDALAGGHHFICASERQRDLWLGALLTRRRIAPDLYDRDPTFRSVIDTVPFGVPAEPPARDLSLPSVRDRFPGIGPDDEIVLWNGGLWRWLDAPTAIRAVSLLAERRAGIRLVFMGAPAHPAAQEAVAEARALADQLGLTDSVVFFNDGWVPYAERANWLLDAACALSTHRDHLEARFAFRTRLLDCFWAGLPVVCTRGDDLSDRVERSDLGAVADPEAPAQVADALARVLERGRAAYGPQLAVAAEEHAWARVAQPIARWAASSERPPRARLARSPFHRLRAAAYRGGRVLLARRRA